MVINGVISRVTIGISCIRGLVTPLQTTHEPPSRVFVVSKLHIMCQVILRDSIDTYSVRKGTSTNEMPCSPEERQAGKPPLSGSDISSATLRLALTNVNPKP